MVIFERAGSIGCDWASDTEQASSRNEKMGAFISESYDSA